LPTEQADKQDVLFISSEDNFEDEQKLIELAENEKVK
jgi:hypothetical protein